MNDKKKIIQKIIPQIGQEKTGVSLHISLHSSSHHALTAKAASWFLINFHCFAFFSVFFIFAQWNRKICRVFLRRHFFPIWCVATGQRRRYTIPTYVWSRGGWGWWVVLLCWVCDSSPLPFLFSLLSVKSVGKWQNSNDHYYEWIDEMEYPLKPSAPPNYTLPELLLPHNGAMHFVLVYNETFV